MSSTITHDDANRIVRELRDTIESKTANLSMSREKIERIQADLDRYEVKNQELTTEVLARKNADIQLKEKVEDIERQMYRLPGGKAVSDSTVEMKKALDIFLRKADNQKSSDELALEKKYLRTDNDPSGGYLTPFEYSQEILKKITEISPVRRFARVLRTSRESLHIPVRESLLAGNWIGEGNDYVVSNSTYGIREIKVNTLSVSSETTIQMVQDSVFNIEDQISQDISESFAQTEGRAFVTGDGVGKPEGLLARTDGSGPQVFPSGDATAFDGDSLINIAGQLKVGYAPAYMLNRKTLAFVRTLKDGIGQYLWTPGIANVYPSMINGHPYIDAIDVPDVGANQFPVIFGDFFRGYLIVDHINMFLIRDNFTQSARGRIVFNAIRRVGGQIVLAEAIKLLKCAVS